ncbi:MAG: amino acid ABC transporter permease [Albidovulum sp.]|nr:amino acid ABC transporter permease [Albidovulum sp.]MDE0304119.1 amino acid ABC transporter permease [Albidovulum sp.]MDE0533385.1 amino acid ABC transporter permease [Albidovulum sp.]
MSFDWGILWDNIDILLFGAWNTASVMVLSLIFGTIIGGLVCAGNLQEKSLYRIPTRVYTHVFRTLPEMALIFWVYLALPLVLGIRMSAFSAGTLALSLVVGAFLGEIFRAGIVALPRGQIEAARALGLGFVARWFKVILPQAIKLVLPAIVNFITELLKLTSLLAAISVGELAYQAYVLGGQSFKYNEFFTSVAIAYFCMIFPVTLLARRLEKKIAA